MTSISAHKLGGSAARTTTYGRPFRGRSRTSWRRAPCPASIATIRPAVSSPGRSDRFLQTCQTVTNIIPTYAARLFQGCRACHQHLPGQSQHGCRAPRYALAGFQRTSTQRVKHRWYAYYSVGFRDTLLPALRPILGRLQRARCSVRGVALVITRPVFLIQGFRCNQMVFRIRASL